MYNLDQYLNEKQNTNKYDGVREYCLREKVNEEYARTAIKKTHYFRMIRIAVMNNWRKWIKWDRDSENDQNCMKYNSKNNSSTTLPKHIATEKNCIQSINQLHELI